MADMPWPLPRRGTTRPDKFRWPEPHNILPDRFREEKNSALRPSPARRVSSGTHIRRRDKKPPDEARVFLGRTMLKLSSYVKAYVENWESGIQGMIDGFLEDGENCVAWVRTKTAPNELLNWVPLLNLYYMARSRYCIVALTSRRVLVIEVKSDDHKYPLGCRSIPLSQVSDLSALKLSMSPSLVLTETDGASTRFKDISFEQSENFVSLFRQMPGRSGGAPRP